ncbi:hypothetical protein C8J57DRAFT_1532112 [Mycena rebaudengoi]|nr:hypothetical protein C8J57DRAFT_1532112 [Mycena rebaudengoi]
MPAVPIVVPTVSIRTLTADMEDDGIQDDDGYDSAIPTATPLPVFRSSPPPLPPTPAAPPITSAAEHKRLKKIKKTATSHKRCTAKRETLRANTVTGAKTVTLARKHLATPLSTTLRFSHHTLPLASTAWMGLRDSAILDAAEHERAAQQENEQAEAAEVEELFLPEPHAYELAETTEMDMHLVPWDGTPTPLVDAERLNFGLLCSFPNDADWGFEVAATAFHLTCPYIATDRMA